MRYLIYCDESDDKGRYYSNFYGGVLLREDERLSIERALEQSKGDLIGREFKWTKIGPVNEQNYIEFVRAIFALVESGALKIRLMFTQNINRPHRTADYDEENRYFILYYQFLKHAFGLQFCNDTDSDQVVVSVFLDEVPHTHAKFDNFKNFLSSLTNYPLFFNSRIAIPKPGITSIDSRDHVILQAIDVVLGAIQFRLNEKHKEIPEGARVRGKRTRSKERVYKEINRLIRTIYPNFNIGISTGQTTPMDRWNHRYAHWVFVPRASVKDLARGKKMGKKK